MLIVPTIWTLPHIILTTHIIYIFDFFFLIGYLFIIKCVKHFNHSNFRVCIMSYFTTCYLQWQCHQIVWVYWVWLTTIIFCMVVKNESYMIINPGFLTIFWEIGKIILLLSLLLILLLKLLVNHGCHLFNASKCCTPSWTLHKFWYFYSEVPLTKPTKSISIFSFSIHFQATFQLSHPLTLAYRYARQHAILFEILAYPYAAKGTKKWVTKFRNEWQKNTRHYTTRIWQHTVP